MKELIISTIPFEFKKTPLNESIQLREQLSGGKMLVSGIIQRANTKNQNERIYPKNILAPKVEQYIEQYVKNRNALGELDHSQCFREGDVLTTNGWKDLKDVTTDDVVATLNMDSDSIAYQKVNKVINQDYSGKLISIKGKNIDVNVTPNHRFVVRDRYGKLLIKTAQELLELSKTIQNTHLSIPTDLNNIWIGKLLNFRFIKIEEYDYTGKVYCINVDNGTFYYRNGLCQLWTGNSQTVELKNVSHNIVEMHWEGNDLLGTIEVLPTPSGNILKELLNANITIGISSRGMGSVIKDNRLDAYIVQSDFDIICWDMVSTPSTQGAFIKPTTKMNKMNESYIIKPDKNSKIYFEIGEIVGDILTDI